MGFMYYKKLDKLLSQSIYGLKSEDKYPVFIDAVLEVTRHHYEKCKPYRRFCEKRMFNPDSFSTLDDLTYLPTSLFKDVLLLSVPEDEVFREIKSSATSTGRSSRIGLDKETSRRQSKCFNKVVLDRIGDDRREFIVLDESSSLGKGSVVTARSSTIRSLLFCSSEAHTCIVEENGQLRLDENKLDTLLKMAEKNPGNFIIFGFTFILYIHVIQKLLESGKKYELAGAKILHIGGWKKLESAKVTPEKLVSDCCEVLGVLKEDIVDFYGFTEQAGLIYPTCEEGVRHTPVWADVIVRDPLSLRSLPIREEGLLQFITPIQTSYPGHSVLTEDVGYIIGVDECSCGRKGKTFKVVGRAEKAEVRGCGDIMGDKFA